MKKFLSLVLALVMTMSLVTVSAGAKDFTDDDKITYEEAVNVISEIGVVDGYADGKFNPTNTLTRQAAAKIICNLILGPTTAAELHADTAPYKDVPATSQFAGYIAYCAKEGIISGYADGSFKPGNTLTGYAFMKMLLGALGYDAETEGYTGANWSINVAKRALGIGLNSSLVGEFNGVKAVTREEAALYAFNTLKATMVEYDEQSTIVVGGATVTLSGKAQDVAWGTGTLNDGKVDKDGFVQFAEKYFPKLTRTDDIDPFGRPANKWTYNKKDIDSYVDYTKMVSEYTVKVEGGDVYSDIGSVASDFDLTYWVDGEKLDKAATKTQAEQIAKKNDDQMGNSGNGVLTQIFVDNDAEELTIVEINTYLAKTDDYNEKKETLKIDTIYGYGYGKYDDVETLELEDFPEIENYADGDLVLLTIAAGEVQTIVDAETVEGVEIDEFSKHDYVVAGSEYDYAATGALAASYGYSLLSDYDKAGGNLDGKTFDLYLDTYGYLIGIKQVEDDVEYVFITSYEITNKYLTNRTAKASAIFSDGTEAVIEVDLKNSADAVVADWVSVNASGKTNENRWYEYTVKEDAYRLTLAADQIHDTTTDKIDSKHISQKGVKADGVTADPNYYYGNADTNYIIVGVDDVNGYVAIDSVDNVATGVKNVSINVWNMGQAKEEAELTQPHEPVSYGIYTVYDGAYAVASIVVGDDGSITDRYAYLYDEPSRERYVASEDTYYWDMDAVIGGEKTTVTFKGDLELLDDVKGAFGVEGGMFKLSYDKDGYVIDIDTLKYGTDYNHLADYANGTVKPDDVKMLMNGVSIAVDLEAEGDTLWITAQTAKRGYTLADTCPAVVIEMDGDSIDKATEYTTVEKAIKSLENYVAGKSTNFSGTIYLIFTDGIVSSVVMTDHVSKSDNKNTNVGDLKVGIVEVKVAEKQIVLDKADKPEAGRAWTAEEKAAVDAAAKAALIDAGYEAVSDVSFGAGAGDTINAVNSNASNTQTFEFTIVWG